MTLFKPANPFPEVNSVQRLVERPANLTSGGAPLRRVEKTVRPPVGSPAKRVTLTLHRQAKPLEPSGNKDGPASLGHEASR